MSEKVGVGVFEGKIKALIAESFKSMSETRVGG